MVGMNEVLVQYSGMTRCDGQSQWTVGDHHYSPCCDCIYKVSCIDD